MFKTLSFVLAFVLLFSATPVMAQEMCEVDSNYDGKVDLTDLVKMKAEFLRADCPDRPASVQKTGQTISYAIGDDGYLQKGVEKPSQKDRFTDNRDETITDNVTGLRWHKNANLFGQRSWAQALNDIATLNNPLAYSDWRLPNVRELQTLLDYSQRNPALPSAHPFLNTPLTPAFYWSATTKMGVEPSPFVEAYGVNLGDGTVEGYLKSSNEGYIWPVRGGQ